MHFWMVAPWRHAGLRYKSSKLAENNRHIPQQGPRQCIKTGTETTNNRCSCHMAHTRSTEPLFFGQEQSAHTHAHTKCGFWYNICEPHLFAHLFSFPTSGISFSAGITLTYNLNCKSKVEKLDRDAGATSGSEVFVSIIVWYSVTTY